MALVQHWKLDDNAASTTVVATVGTNATLNGGDNTSVLHAADGPGTAITNSLHFNGTDDTVDISAAGVSFPTNSTWSISFFFKRDTTSGTYSMVGRSASGVHNIRTTGASGTNIVFVDNGGNQRIWTITAPGTTWHHILLACDASRNMRCFIDGTESSTGTLTPANSACAPQRLASENGVQFYDGYLAWMKMFDSNEVANVAALVAEKDASGGTVIPVFMNQYRQRVT